MLKDNLQATLPAEDVIVKKSKLADALSKPKKTRKAFTLVAVLAALILISAVAVGIWWTQPMQSAFPDLQMYAVRIEEDGTQHQRGQVAIKGTRYDYHDPDALPELHATELTILEEVLSTDTAVLYYLPYGTISGFWPTVNGSYALTIDLSPDGDWCVIRKNCFDMTHFIVCSTDENFDPMEIFKTSIFGK